MGKRLGIGFVKGLVLGALIGSGVTWGLHWATPSGGVLAYLFALGVGGTTGIFAGRAPWKEGAWVEAVIKGLVGVLAAALAYWLASMYGPLQIPWPGIDHRVPWTSLPPLYLGAIGAVYGALVELDHDADDDEKPAKKSAPKTRVADPDDDDGAAATKAARKRTP